jgi:hypothetical protein
MGEIEWRAHHQERSAVSSSNRRPMGAEGKFKNQIVWIG